MLSVLIGAAAIRESLMRNLFLRFLTNEFGTTRH